MITYVLILFFHVGLLGDTDSNTTTVVPKFVTIQECQDAGAQAEKLVKGTKKELEFVCVKQTVGHWTD